MIALFGGTFNPVHEGHISLAREVRAAFGLDYVEFLPSYLPVHRSQPETSAHLRRELVKIAIRPYSELTLNSCEIDRQGPSYTVETLAGIKSDLPELALCWLMGADSFNSLLSWKNPAGILKLANLIVCTRPAIKLDMSVFPAHYLKKNESLTDFKAGKITFFNMQPNNCSSTQIRQMLRKGLSVSGCLPRPVLEFIKVNKLYR